MTKASQATPRRCFVCGAAEQAKLEPSQRVAGRRRRPRVIETRPHGPEYGSYRALPRLPWTGASGPVRDDRDRRRGPRRRGDDGSRHVHDAVLHAGRHPRCDQVPERRRLRAARRPDRARQHVPPDAAARRRHGRPVRRSRRVRRLGRPDAHRLRWLPGLLARAEGRRRRRHVPQHVRRLDPSLHARGRDGHPGAARRRHPDGARRLPAAAEPARRRRARRQAHRAVGEAGPGRAQPRRPGAVRHRPGRHRSRICAGRAPSHTAELDFDGYGIGGLSVGETRAEMLPALPPRPNTSRPIGRAT